MIRAVFLDRDGVINRKCPDDGYVTCWNEMQFLPGVAEAIALLNQNGFQVIVVSNQRCVAKGLVTVGELEIIHQRMRDELALAGAIIDGVYYCPHEKQPACNCRKPAPAMLLKAAEERDLDLKASWMIGDSDVDIEAGKNAGCKTARLLAVGELAHGNADVAASSLFEAIHHILQREDEACGENGIRVLSI
jgi:D-glycero-D-manno-heptose 1,7-bisphosphate phosphatase